MRVWFVPKAARQNPRKNGLVISERVAKSVVFVFSVKCTRNYRGREWVLYENYNVINQSRHLCNKRSGAPSIYKITKLILHPQVVCVVLGAVGTRRAREINQKECTRLSRSWRTCSVPWLFRRPAITRDYCMQIFGMQPDVGVVSQESAFFKGRGTKTAQQKINMPVVCGALAKNSLRWLVIKNVTSRTCGFHTNNLVQFHEVLPFKTHRVCKTPNAKTRACDIGRLLIPELKYDLAHWISKFRNRFRNWYFFVIGIKKPNKNSPLVISVFIFY